MISKYKKTLSFALKIAIVIFAFWYIYKKLIANDNVSKFIQLIKNLPDTEIFGVLSIVFVLMFINWGLEALKWKRVIKGVEPISFGRAIESVFCGLTWAVFTPNRIGEYGGRVFFLSPRKRIVGVVAMAVGNIAQLILTNFFGPIMLCVFVYRFIPLDTYLFVLLCVLTVIFVGFFVTFFFNINWLNRLLLAIKFTQKYKRFYEILGRYEKKELLKILGYAFARYAVFTSQYLIMFNWLLPELHAFDVIMMVCVMFFVQSSLPSLDLLDVGVRSLTASYLFGFVTSNIAVVVTVTASIWLINLIIPAILGSYFVFKLNFFGTTNKDL